VEPRSGGIDDSRDPSHLLRGGHSRSQAVLAEGRLQRSGPDLAVVDRGMRRTRQRDGGPRSGVQEPPATSVRGGLAPGIRAGSRWRPPRSPPRVSVPRRHDARPGSHPRRWRRGHGSACLKVRSSASHRTTVGVFGGNCSLLMRASSSTAPGPRPAVLGGCSRLQRRQLAPRLRRPQREAGEVGLASVPGSACTFGRRQQAVGIDLALEPIQHGSTCRRRPRAGISGPGPRLVRGEPRDQRAVGRHGDEAALPSPVRLRRGGPWAERPDGRGSRGPALCTAGDANHRHLAAVVTGAPVLAVSAPLQDAWRLTAGRPETAVCPQGPGTAAQPARSRAESDRGFHRAWGKPTSRLRSRTYGRRLQASRTLFSAVASATRSRSWTRPSSSWRVSSLSRGTQCRRVGVTGVVTSTRRSTTWTAARPEAAARICSHAR
jgi:hypothetical protein